MLLKTTFAKSAKLFTIWGRLVLTGIFIVGVKHIAGWTALKTAKKINANYNNNLAYAA